MRVLVAYQEEYRAYREVVAAGIRMLRPRTEVVTAASADLEAKIALLDPWVVICGVLDHADPGHTLAWVEVPSEVGRPARIRVGDERWESDRLTLEELLEVTGTRPKSRPGDGGPRGRPETLGSKKG